MRSLLVLALALSLASAGCSSKDQSPPRAATSAPKAAAKPVGLRLIPVPYNTRSAEKFIAAARAKAAREARELLVYVGATWCAPCVIFIDAVKAGKLNTTFPKLDLVKLDYDRHRMIIEPAGYLTKYVPLFARPKSDGSSSTERFMGAPKGAKGLASIVKRLKGLLRASRE